MEDDLERSLLRVKGHINDTPAQFLSVTTSIKDLIQIMTSLNACHAALDAFSSAVWLDPRLPEDMREQLKAVYHNQVLPALEKAK